MSAGEAPPSDPVRVGLVGLGNSGWFYHAQAHLHPSPNYELVAVCAEHRERAHAAAARFGARPYTDWHSLVQAPDVELVVIALPHHLHHPVAVAAAQAGKHVLVEKPIAVSVREADEMVAAAEEAGVLLSVFHQRRWEEDFQTILRCVVDGLVGEVWNVEVARSHQGRYRRPGTDRPHAGDEVLEWPHRRRAGGGISYLVGPHPVDQLLQLVRTPAATVSGRVHHDPDEGGDDGVEDFVEAAVTFEDGTLGRVAVFRRSGIAPPRFAVYGRNGTLVSRDGSAVELVQFDGESRVIGGLRRPGLEGAEVYDGLYAAIRHGAPPPVTAAQGRAAVEVLELALRSGGEGGAPLATSAAASAR